MSLSEDRAQGVAVSDSLVDSNPPKLNLRATREPHGQSEHGETMEQRMDAWAGSANYVDESNNTGFCERFQEKNSAVVSNQNCRYE